ncbi:MAG TPA: hypothetical protein VL860_05835 [Planctomycetota bacterium]|nr:hypothetical protein [Planctomycetota bacterium]
MLTAAPVLSPRATIAIDQIYRLVDLAATAPSGDNLQPWMFVWDPGRSRLLLQVHPTRDLTVMNTGFRMARIACGAALENIHQCAGAVGLIIEAEIFRSEDSVELTLRSADCCVEAAARVQTVRNRVTNRKLYDARPLSGAERRQLEQVAQDTRPNPVETRFFFQGDQKADLDRTIAAIDATVFALKEMRECLAEQVQQAPHASAESAHGMPIDALELGRLDRMSFRLLPKYPEWAMRSILRGVSEGYAFDRLRSATGICLLTAPRHLRNADLLAGRMFQRVWLAMTAMGLSVQPMMSAVGMQTFYRSSQETIIERLNRWGAPELLARLNTQAGIDDPSMEIAGILRFGTAEPPTARTGRLHLDQLLTVI